MNRSLAMANDPIAEEAAVDHLVSGGSAVGAALSGFFAAAGGYSGVLLGPLTVLVGGIGTGVRAFDGRLRQPGLGTKRPRGFTSGEPIPDAARVAVPVGVLAAVVALAYDGGQKLRSVVKAGVARAERSGAAERANLLRRIGVAGAAALAEAAFVRPLLRSAGLTEGGLLTPADLAAVPDFDHPAAELPEADGTLYEAPWAGELPQRQWDTGLGSGCCVCAVDVRGVFAGVCYRRLGTGFTFEDLELEAPLAAVPVERGVTRTAPGAALPAPAPLALRRDPSGALVEIVAAPAARRLERRAGAPAPMRIIRDPRTLEVRAEREGRS